MIKQEIVTNEPRPYSMWANLMIQKASRDQRCFREHEDTPVDVDFLLERISEVFPSIKRKESDKIYTDSKNEYTAEKFRRKAKSLFSQKLNQEALTLYNKAVSHAPNGSEELGLAYCGRSEVLFAQQLYYECLLDINRATENELPENSRVEIQERKESCLTHLKGVDNNIMQNPNATEPFENTNNTEVRDDCTPSVGVVEIEMPDTSDGTPARMGMIALRDVNPGELVYEEGMFATALDPLYQFTRCDYCLKAYPALIPCPSCTSVLYCTRTCRQNAFDLYHRVECQVIKLYGKRTRDTLGLRTFLAGTDQGEYLLKLYENMVDWKHIFQVAKVMKMTDNDCVNVYPLTLWNCKKFSKDMLYSKATRPDVLSIVVRTILALRNVEFFRTPLVELTDGLIYVTRMEKFAALLLMNNVISLEREEFRIIIDKKQRIGFGVYLCLGFSFDPRDSNTSAIAISSTRIRHYYALRPIKAGEAINCSYTHYQEEYENAESLVSSQLKDWNLLERIYDMATIN